MRYPRFSLLTLLIAVTVCSVVLGFGYRALVGSQAERTAAIDAAERAVKDHALYEHFKATSVRPAGVNPRAFRVYGIADGKKPIAVVVQWNGDSFEWYDIETDHTR